MGKKAGRKRKPGKREPNGKPSRRVADRQARRAIDEEAAMLVAKEARQRVHGVKASESGTELAGTVIGRLLLQGSISREHYDAAVAFQATYAAYQRVMDSPRQPKAVEIGGSTGGAARDVSPEQSARARKQWEDACIVLSRANEEHRTSALYAAVLYVVIREQYLPHLFGDLRLGLNALVRHYGLTARAA